MQMGKIYPVLFAKTVRPVPLLWSQVEQLAFPVGNQNTTDIYRPGTIVVRLQVLSAYQRILIILLEVKQILMLEEWWSLSLCSAAHLDVLHTITTIHLPVLFAQNKRKIKVYTLMYVDKILSCVSSYNEISNKNANNFRLSVCYRAAPDECKRIVEDGRDRSVHMLHVIKEISYFLYSLSESYARLQNNYKTLVASFQ